MSLFWNLIEPIINLTFSFILNHFNWCFANLGMVNLTANCSLFFLNDHVLFHSLVFFMSLLVIKDFFPSSLLSWSWISLRSKCALFHFFFLIFLFKKLYFLSFVFLEVFHSFICSLFQFFLYFCFSLHFRVFLLVEQ